MSFWRYGLPLDFRRIHHRDSAFWFHRLQQLSLTVIHSFHPLPHSNFINFSPPSNPFICLDFSARISSLSLRKVVDIYLDGKMVVSLFQHFTDFSKFWHLQPACFELTWTANTMTSALLAHILNDCLRMQWFSTSNKKKRKICSNYAHEMFEKFAYQATIKIENLLSWLRW